MLERSMTVIVLTVIVVSCKVFRLTVSEAKTEITCLQTLLVDGKLVVQRHCSRRGIHSKLSCSCTWAGLVSTTIDLSVDVTRRL